MKRILLLLTVIALSLNLKSQKSIHQEQLEYYNSLGPKTDAEYDQMNKYRYLGQQIYDRSCTLNKIVFGWHPYWMGSVYNNYNWSMLSDLCYFSYEFDPATGNPTNTHNWSTAAVVSAAQSNGTRVHLCVTLFSDHATFLTNSTAKQTLINNLVSAVQARNANGINVDFEGVPSTQKTNFANWMIDLANAFHTQIPGSKVSIALPAVDWSSAYDVAAMKNHVDWFIIMGYDYYYSGSTTAGPTDPLYNYQTSYNYTLSKSITYYLSQGIDPNKLLLGLPYYGRHWQVTSTTLPSPTVSGTSASKTLKTVLDNADGYYSSSNKNWNNATFQPYYNYQISGKWYQCWINDVYSMGRRFDMVNQRGLRGIGIWALGYDDGYTYFWNLIKDKFSSCAIVPCTDSLFDMGGPERNYYDKENWAFTISPTGATSITMTFTSFETEANYDTLWIFDGPSTNSPLIGAYHGTNSPGTINSTGNSLTLKFKSDNATNKSGFRAVYSCTMDNIPPSIQISTPGTWKTGDFTATYIDTDNSGGSGVEKSYYQVLENRGNEWRANNQRGFFADAFNGNTIHTDWTIFTGTWSISNGSLKQSDETLSNTNIYAPLKQNLSNRYLYHFIAKFDGSGSNKRFGFHFFCDNAALTNRGNSYFVWFRQSSNQLEFYKVINDTFTLMKSVPCTIIQNQFHDFKVIYDRTTGKIDVYVNNNFVGSWTDTNPLNNGNYISFRTGNCQLFVDEIKVYRSRSNTTLITVGNDNSKDIRYQNPSPNQPGGMINSLAIDNAKNISSIYSHNLNIDWTPPSQINYVIDGLGEDLDTILNTGTISAKWTKSVDNNSGILRYWYAIGTTPGDSSIVNWTNNGTDTSFTQTSLNLTNGTKYYVSIRAENNAQIKSSSTSSDGFLAQNAPIAQFTSNTNNICPGTTINFINNSLNSTNYEWSFPGGSPATSSSINPSVVYNNPGIYQVKLIAHNNVSSDTLIINNYITVYQPPVVNSIEITNESVCNSGDGTIKINASGASPLEYSINGGGTFFQNNGYFTNLSAGNYNIYIRDNNSCTTNYGIVNISAGGAPNAPLVSGSNTYCEGQNINPITAIPSQGGVIKWYSDYALSNLIYTGTSFTPSVNIGTNTFYATETVGSCESPSSQVNIIVNPLPENPSSIQGNTSLCFFTETSSYYINQIPNANNYIWTIYPTNAGTIQNNNNNATVNWNQNFTGIATIQVTGSNNCGNSPSPTQINVTVHNIPTITNINISHEINCGDNNGTIIINSPDASEYSINNGLNFQSNNIFTNLVPGFYYIKVKNTYGCTKSLDTVISILRGNPGISPIVSNDTSYCYGENITPLIATGHYNGTITWYLDSSLTQVYATGNSVVPITSYGTKKYYVIENYNNNNCTTLPSTVAITIKSVPDNASMPQGPTQLCINSPNTLYSTFLLPNVTSYQWRLNPPTAGIVNGTGSVCSVNWDNDFTGFVQLFVRGINECGAGVESDPLNINIFPEAIANFTVLDSTLELPNAIAFFSNLSENANSYTWFFGDGSTSTDFMPWHQYTDTGCYNVTLIAYNNICGNDTITKHNIVCVDLITNSKLDEFNEISIYPNPFNDFIEIKGNLIKKLAEIQLIKLNGQLVYKKSVTPQNDNSLILKFDKTLLDGTYILIMKTNDNKIEHHLINKLQ